LEKLRICFSTVQTVETVSPVKTIEIDDDVYEALLGRIRDFGDTPNLVLRRELNLGGTGMPVTTSRETPLQEFLTSTEFRFAKGAVGRFLAVLSWLYKKDAAAFSIVGDIRGRGRIYFSKSVQELEQSGRSVNPKKIPDSPFWVITTTPTDLKQQILGEVMKALGHDLSSIQLAKRAIAR
jgi:negative modulator of initiation of replication